MNTIILMGRAVADPEMRFLDSGIALTTVTIAVDRPGTYGDNKKTDFIRCVAWRKTAEYVANYLNKGARFMVKGYLTQEKYKDKNGDDRHSFNVTCDEVKVLDYDSPRKQTSNSQPRPASGPPIEKKDDGFYGGHGFQEIPFDDDVPF